MNMTKMRRQKLQSKIQDARGALIADKPFFGLLLMYLKYVAVDNIRNISTNGRCIFFSPAFIEKLMPNELQFVLCHQLMHILNGDLWRDVAYAGDEYHRAFDIITNRELLKMGWSVSGLTHLGKLQYTIPLCPYDLDKLSVNDIFQCFPFRLRMLDEKTRNRYMADSDFWWDYKDDNGSEGITIIDLPKMTTWAVKPEEEKEDAHREVNDETEDGSMTDSEESEESDSGSIGPTNSARLADFWETKAQLAMQAALDQSRNRGAGRIPDSIKRSMDDRHKSKADWRELLNNFVQEEVSDYSFTPPDRRFADSDFFLPDFNEKDITPKDILFMADTSGSVDQEELGMVYAELRSAIEQFKGKISGKLGFFDTAVTPPIPFENVCDLERIIPYGGGGTDFHVIFEYVRNEMQSCLPSAIVIFTDGEGPYPSEQDIPDIPVLWLINNNEETPPFGKVARILPDYKHKSE